MSITTVFDDSMFQLESLFRIDYRNTKYLITRVFGGVGRRAREENENLYMEMKRMQVINEENIAGIKNGPSLRSGSAGEDAALPFFLLLLLPGAGEGLRVGAETGTGIATSGAGVAISGAGEDVSSLEPLLLVSLLEPLLMKAASGDETGAVIGSGWDFRDLQEAGQ
ncbi:hypothetical protein HAX54_009020 [Datura stramonium]|uniref:Uncharacterized protein n=1 Tax=Datura stramonium TaxID=4076 RepID=A0ABS8TE88_DATST|nr:hypothetical protein [Datura stramonium]